MVAILGWHLAAQLRIEGSQPAEFGVLPDGCVALLHESDSETRENSGVRRREEIIKVVDAASARFKGILAGFAISGASAQPPSPDANNNRVARN
jgi:hypothetical protein